MPHPSRRALLTALAGGLGLFSAAACRAGTGEDHQVRPEHLDPVLASAIYLSDRYQTSVTALPDLAGRLNPLRESHRAHIVALCRELGIAEQGRLPAASPPGDAPAASWADQAATLAGLKALELAGQQQAARACLAGPGYHAALLGSIAAARACHAEVLT